MLGLALPGCGGGAGSSEPGASGSLTVARDEWGIAHVLAPTDEGAFYGAGYSMAEDRLFQMHLIRRTMQGRLSELIGARSNPLGESTTLSDQRMRHMGAYENAQLRAAHLDAETVALLEAFCAGVNQYIVDHVASLHYLFEGQVPEAWTPADCLAAWDHQISWSLSEFEVDVRRKFDKYAINLGWLGAAQKLAPTELSIFLDDSGVVVRREDVPQSIQDAMKAYAGAHPPFGRITYTYFSPPPVMSQAWAVNAGSSATGSAFLFGNPQVDISSPNFWYECHMKGETFDVRGISAPGAPAFFAGFSRDIAWTMTGAGVDDEDLFKLEMVAPDTYRFDGIERDLEVRTEIIEAKGGPSTTIEIKRSHLGPVVTDLLTQAVSGDEYVLLNPLVLDPSRSTIQALVRMMRATDVVEFGEALEGYRNPSTHCLFVDSKGSIGYWLAAVVPVRSSEAPLAGYMAHFGHDSRFLWVEELPHHLKPHTIDPPSGVIFAANNRTVGSWYPIYEGALATTLGDTFRSMRLRELMEVPGKLFTRQDMLDVHLDGQLAPQRVLVRAGLLLKEQGLLTPTARQAVDLLEGWYQMGAQALNFTENFPGLVLILGIPLRFRAGNAGGLVERFGDGVPGLVNYTKYLRSELAGHSTYAFEHEEVQLINGILTEAWEESVAQFGSDPALWEWRFNIQERGQLSIPYFQGANTPFGSLDPLFDQTFGGLVSPSKNHLGSQIAQSYSLFVDFSLPDGVEALSPMGISEDPESPHFADQALLWRYRRLRPAPLLEENLSFESVLKLSYQAD